jgi:putative phosphonate catabolism associated alcohol dehydrogenase
MTTPSFHHVALFYEPGRPLELIRTPLPALGPGEILVRIRCCTLCGSDFHTIAGRRSGPVPAILGHESIGVIEAIGPGAPPPHDLHGSPLSPGDRILWSLIVSCGDCDRCRGGLPQKCRHLFKYGHQRYAPDAPPSGGLAEFCVLRPKSTIVRVPPSIPDTLGATIACAGATVSAALHVAAIHPGDAVLIQGAGMLGLVAAAMARHAGAGFVGIVDPLATRCHLALQFGANAYPRATDCPRSVDCVLEFSGHPDAFTSGLAQLDIGGRLILAGAVFPAPPALADAETIVRNLIRIEGVHNYAPAHLQTAVDFFASPASATYPFAQLIAATFPLHQVNAAIAFGMERHPVRIAVLP